MPRSVSRQLLRERLELPGVTQRAPVTEADEGRLELGQLPHRLAIAHRIGTEERVRLVQTWEAGERVDVRVGVAADQRAVGLPPEGDVAGGVAGHVEGLEPRDVITLAHPPGHWMRGPGKRPSDQ